MSPLLSTLSSKAEYLSVSDLNISDGGSLFFASSAAYNQEEAFTSSI